MTHFDPALFARALAMGHNGRLGIVYRDHARDIAGTGGWIELALPGRADLAGPRGGTATGAIAALMDMAMSMAVWAKRDRFVPHATLDLRLDHLRDARTGATLVAYGECYRIAGPVAFVRGVAHEGDPDDPVVHVAGCFMATGATA